MSLRDGLKVFVSSFIALCGSDQSETFAVRRLIASTYGPRQAQDTKSAFAAHEKLIKP